MTYPAAHTLSELQHNLAAVQKRIAAACRRTHRGPDEVRLLPVSKTIDEARLRLAYQAGCRELGENKVQEAQRKTRALADLTDLRWPVIGHLQSNKAKMVARFSSEFQALDSLRVAAALERHLQMESRALDVLIQVNTSGEDSKYGLAPDTVADFVRRLPAFPCLRVKGLMTLAVFSPDPIRVRPCFARLWQFGHRTSILGAVSGCLEHVRIGTRNLCVDVEVYLGNREAAIIGLDGYRRRGIDPLRSET